MIFLFLCRDGLVSTQYLRRIELDFGIGDDVRDQIVWSLTVSINNPVFQNGGGT